jgi:hypothetical protein
VRPRAYPFVLPSDGYLVRGIKGPVSRDASPTPDFNRWADMINNTMDESLPDHAHAKTKVSLSSCHELVALLTLPSGSLP